MLRLQTKVAYHIEFSVVVNEVTLVALIAIALYHVGASDESNNLGVVVRHLFVTKMPKTVHGRSLPL
jgi:hypothetical protein